jgi:hypothetical protein
MVNKYGLSYDKTISSFLDEYAIMRRYWQATYHKAIFNYKLFLKDTNCFALYPYTDPGSMTYCLSVLEGMGKDIRKEWDEQ